MVVVCYYLLTSCMGLFSQDAHVEEEVTVAQRRISLSPTSEDQRDAEEEAPSDGQLTEAQEAPDKDLI